MVALFYSGIFHAEPWEVPRNCGEAVKAEPAQTPLRLGGELEFSVIQTDTKEPCGTVSAERPHFSPHATQQAAVPEAPVSHIAEWDGIRLFRPEFFTTWNYVVKLQRVRVLRDTACHSGTGCATGEATLCHDFWGVGHAVPQVMPRRATGKLCSDFTVQLHLWRALWPDLLPGGYGAEPRVSDASLPFLACQFRPIWRR